MSISATTHFSWPAGVRCCEAGASIFDLLRAAGWRSPRDAWARRSKKRGTEVMGLVTFVVFGGKAQTPVVSAANCRALAALLGIGEAVGLGGAGVGVGGEALGSGTAEAIGGDLSLADADVVVVEGGGVEAPAPAEAKARARPWHWDSRSGWQSWPWPTSTALSRLMPPRPATAGLGEVLRIHAATAQNRGR